MSTISDSAIHAVAGSVGGCVSMALTYPLVNLSTRAAVQTKKEHLTIPQALTRTIKQEGVSGLYDGLSSSLAGIAVTNGVYYAFYEEMRALLLRRRASTSNTPHSLSTLEGIIAGLVAGSITTLTTNPIWTVQTAQSTRAVTVDSTSSSTSSAEGPGTGQGDGKKVRKVKPSALEAAQAIYKQDGIKGFWRGIGPALILVINPVIQVGLPHLFPFPFPAYPKPEGRLHAGFYAETQTPVLDSARLGVAYTTYERLVGALLAWRIAKTGITSTGKQGGLGRSSLSDWDLFVLGAASKLVATGGTYPYIVVKSRLQAATHKYQSSLKAVLHILQAEGVSGLYAGLLPKLLQSVLTAAFMFVAQRRIYELVKGAILAAAQKRALAARA